jgi:hypothetical protein
MITLTNDEVGWIADLRHPVARGDLLTADGLGTGEIKRKTGTSKVTVRRWQESSCGPGSRVCCAIKLGPRASRGCRRAFARWP